jgi:protein ECT2
MDPVQRVPRYTLLIRTMMKFLAPDDPQRAKLVEAHNLASEIARAETDDYTKRATVMYCLVTTIDGFPADLYSHTRMLVDWIDVEDHVSDTFGSGSISSLHCTLFLFDDKLILVKRPGNGERSAGSLTGIDDLEKARKMGPLPVGLKRSGLVCKGVVEITDVVATDVGGAGRFLQFLQHPEFNYEVDQIFNFTSRTCPMVTQMCG